MTHIQPLFPFLNLKIVDFIGNHLIAVDFDIHIYIYTYAYMCIYIVIGMETPSSELLKETSICEWGNPVQRKSPDFPKDPVLQAQMPSCFGCRRTKVVPRLISTKTVAKRTATSNRCSRTPETEVALWRQVLENPPHPPPVSRSLWCYQRTCIVQRHKKPEKIGCWDLIGSNLNPNNTRQKLYFIRMRFRLRPEPSQSVFGLGTFS